MQPARVPFREWHVNTDTLLYLRNTYGTPQREHAQQPCLYCISSILIGGDVSYERQLSTSFVCSHLTDIKYSFVRKKNGLFSKTALPVQRIKTVEIYVSNALLNRVVKLALLDEMCCETLTYFSWYDDNTRIGRYCVLKYSPSRERKRHQPLTLTLTLKPALTLTLTHPD